MKSILILLFLISCASWDREKCLTTNWYQQGVDDATSTGHENFPVYKRECGKEGIGLASREAEYRKGINEGLRTWCNFQNGFNLGLEGRTSSTKCDQINPAFARGLEEGYREYRMNQRRLRDEEERQKRYTQERDDFRRRVLQNSEAKECVVDSDCVKEGQCLYNYCAHRKQYCTYNSDCKIQGRCREISEVNREGNYFILRVCDYGGGYY